MEPAVCLRAIRALHGLSQRDLAARCGVPRSTVDRIEAGAVSPRIDTFSRVIAGVELELAVLDSLGNRVTVRPDLPGHIDRAGRRFPAHLPAWRTPSHLDNDRTWWGWFRIAWPDAGYWVPEYTYVRPGKFDKAEWGFPCPVERRWEQAT